MLNLINLTRRSKKRHLKDAIIPSSKSTAKIGKDYNRVLIQFVQENWQLKTAQINSPSLRRAMDALLKLKS